MRCDPRPRFFDLGVTQPDEPEAGEEMPDEPEPPVEEAAPQEVALQEIEHRAQIERRAAVELAQAPALLRGGGELAVLLADRTVLARGVAVMLGGPPADVLETGFDQFAAGTVIRRDDFRKLHITRGCKSTTT